MPTSKILSGILIMTQVFFLAACNLPKPESRDDGRDTAVANFIITESKGTVAEDALSPEFNVPKSRMFTFNVCVKDVARSKEIPGQKFYVEEIKKTITTDASSCLVWTEEVPFNFFAEAKYLQWDRTISAKGAFRGARTARLAINPWYTLDKSTPVLDLKNSSAPNMVKTAQVQDALAAPNAKSKDGGIFTIAPLELRFVRVLKETTSEREIIFSTKACLKSPSITKNLSNYTFKIRTFDGAGSSRTIEKTPDGAGCLNWDDSVRFKYYECARHITGSIELENRSLAIQQKLEMAVNPWENGFITFGRDLRFVEKTGIVSDCKQENLPRPQLMLTGYSYSTLSFDYDIDNTLNMSVHKILRFKLDSKVVSYSDMLRGRVDSAQKLRPGVYLLKVAIVKNRDYYNQKTYVTSAEQLITTVDGEIRGLLDFRFTDLKALGDRNTMLIELNPVQENLVKVDEKGDVFPKKPTTNFDDLIDRNNSLETHTYMNSIILDYDKDGGDLFALEPKDSNRLMLDLDSNKTSTTSLVRDYMEFGKKVIAEQQETLRKQADLSEFAKTNSLAVVTANKPASFEKLSPILSSPAVRITAGDIEKHLRSFAVTGKLSPELGKGLCHYWFREVIYNDIEKFYRDNSAYTRALMECMYDLEKAKSPFFVEKRLFVKEIAPVTRKDYTKGLNQNISVANGISLTHTHSKTVSHTKNINFSVGLSQKLAQLFSVGVSAGYNISYATANQESRNNNSSLGANTSVGLQENIFNLEFRRYEECSIVKLNAKYFMKSWWANMLNRRLTTDQQVDAISRGLLVCTGTQNTQPISRVEKYFTLNQDSYSGQVQDRGDAKNRNFFIALRGESELQRLLLFMRNDLKVDESKKTTTPNMSLEALDKIFHTGLPLAPGSYNDSKSDQDL